MKRTYVSTLVVGLSLVLVLLLAGCHGAGAASSSSTADVTAQTQTPTIGQSVAVPWSNQDYYLAKISKIDGDQITVQFADGLNSGTYSAADVRLLVTKTWPIGTKVMAAGPSGQFNPGTIIDADTDVGNYVVKFDDATLMNANVTYQSIMAR